MSAMARCRALQPAIRSTTGGRAPVGAAARLRVSA